MMTKPARTLWQKGPNAPKRLSGRRLQQRRERWFRQHPLCAACEEKGIVRLAQELDHVSPLAQGADDADESNWASLCKACHAEKSLRERGFRPRVKIGISGWPVDDE